MEKLLILFLLLFTCCILMDCSTASLNILCVIIPQVCGGICFELCPSRPISHKPCKIFFPNFIYIFLTLVACVQPTFEKLKLKIADLEQAVLKYRNFIFFKNNLLRYFFETLLMLMLDTICS